MFVLPLHFRPHIFRIPVRLALLGCAIILSAYSASSRSLDEDIPDVLRATVPPPELEASSWVLLDHYSGKVLASHEAEMRVEPASLSKLMTAYIVFSELRKGNLTLETPIHVSERAWRTQGSRTFLPVNTSEPVETMLKGLIVQSGNDAAVALAEHVAGSENGFANLMNTTAAELGLTNSHFENSTGLPSPNHYSSALDIARLGSAIIREFPDFYRYYSIREFTYNDITQSNRNILLARDESVDGMKTGYTKAAGYCLVGSAEREGMRLIAAVFGTASRGYRANAVHSLLKYGFSAYETQKLFDPGKAAVNLPVYKGELNEVAIGLERGLAVTIPRGTAADLQVELFVPDKLIAPVKRGAETGSVKLSYRGTVLDEIRLTAQQDVPSSGWVGRAIDGVKLWFD